MNNMVKVFMRYSVSLILICLADFLLFDEQTYFKNAILVALVYLGTYSYHEYMGRSKAANEVN